MARREGFTTWDAVIIGVLVLAVLLMVYPVFVRERDGRPDVCLSNVKNISLAVQMYVADNGDRFPPPRDWCDVLDYYVKSPEVFHCAKARGASWWGYAYNSPLDSKSMYDVANLANTVVIFESDSGLNAFGGPGLLPDEPRHLGGDNYGFADGSARWLKRKPAGGNRRGERAWLKEPEEAVRWQP